MYGLMLSLEHQEIIKDCWNVYHDWLSVMLDEPKPFVPHAIRDDPVHYSKKMLWHLYHLFIPRREVAGASGASGSGASSACTATAVTTTRNAASSISGSSSSSITSGASTNELTKHVMMCHGVLTFIEIIAKESRLLEREKLWQDFLKVMHKMFFLVLLSISLRL